MMLQARGIEVVIPEKADAIERGKVKGSRGGRPVSFDAEDYKNRNVFERLQQAQELARHRHPLRQTRCHL
jgi:hypothetical protein